MRELKEFRYQKNTDHLLDQEFEHSSRYGKVRLGDKNIFWKKGFSWYCVKLEEVVRSFRRIEAVDTKMCCGNVNFDIQKLVLILKDGTELEALVGDGMVKEAEILYERLKVCMPDIAFGKEAK
ncbi:MAG: hypothetical protein Q4C61_11370 [Lachnospiraceae bacterium]|nr:hypothetical protein [Lachnospiraceae bacterium]